MPIVQTSKTAFCNVMLTFWIDFSFGPMKHNYRMGCYSTLYSICSPLQLIALLFVLNIKLALALTAKSQRFILPPKCQPITVSQCKDLPYNETRFPNLVGDENESDAENGFSTFDPLIKFRCASQLKFFLCSIYFPMCTDKVPIAIGPCRPLCERVRAKCEPVIREFGFPWPVSMNCSKFPLENNDDSMCMKGPMNEEPNDISAKHEEFDMNSFPMEPQVTRTKCTDPTTIYMNRTALCVPLCHSNHGFTKSDLEMAHSLLFVMSLLCVVLTSVCFVTFCFRRQCLMALPETSLFFCSICFAVSAVVYLFSLLYKDQISCMRYTTRLIFVSSGVQHIPCTTVAIILYYCGTTGRLWWFILCCSWNKLFTRQQHTAGKQLLRTHVLAWTVPLGAVMLALMAQSVHADSLSGICLVGSDSRMMEAIFVTLREFIMLLCCLVPLFFGCLALVGSASVNEHSMVSSGILGGLYPITATVILLSSLQHLFSPTITVWNTIRAVRLLADPTLGIVSSAGCLFQIIYNILKTNRSPHVDKHGYQPALPQLPHPIHMPNAEFVNTYSATANADQRPLC